jgi:hypothetical protein
VGEMAVTEEQAVKLFDEFVEVCVAVVKDAHAFIGTHDLRSNPFLMDKYPALGTDMFYDDKYFKEEFRNQVSFLKYKIPKYEMKQYPKDKKCYSSIFETYRSEHIDLKKYEKIDEIKQWINSQPEVLKVFSDKEELSDYLVRGIVNDIVERYLYMTNATESVPDDIEKVVKPYVAERLCFYLEDTLFFDICIPVCLATFAKDTIKLDENVEITYISDDIQKARQITCQYEVAKEDWVAACATHMVVLHGYSYEKKKEYSFDSLMQDYSCYPLEKIDEIFGMIRVATGFQIGYEHIFCLPKGWIYETIADLSAVYGAKSHFVNPKFIKMNWMNLPVSCVTEVKCDEIVSLYKDYQNNEKKLKFALMRFNRCMLRDEVDDMTTGACIGLESLLAGNAHSEITNAIASRIPFVFSKLDNAKYLATNGRSYMKKIYNLRSRIVHGGELKDKDIYIDNGKERIYVPQMAVDFLRLTLLFMIKNPTYLKVEEIDAYVDSLVSNS